MITGTGWRVLRERAKLSVRKFAGAMGVSPTYVSMVETDVDSRGYSCDTAMRAVLVLKLRREDAIKALACWRAIHASEVAKIDQFISEVPE